VKGVAAKLPLAVLLREHWVDVVRVIIAATIASVSTIFTVYALTFAVNTVGLSKTPMLLVGVLANVAAVITIPLWAKLSDRVGRKKIFIFGSLGCAVLIFPYLGAIAAGSYGWIFVVGIAMFGVVYTATNAVWPAFYGEMFPARVRLSGTAIGTQIGFAISGFLPSIASAVGGDGKGAWISVSIFTAGLCLLNVIAVASGKETYRVPTEQLGRKESTREVPVG
jgi:MFS family permease